MIRPICAALPFLPLALSGCLGTRMGTADHPWPTANPAPLIDADGEKMMWPIAQQMAAGFQIPTTVLRAYSLDREWIVERNPLTGIVTDRYGHAVLYLKANGQCISWNCNLIEDSVHEEWGAPRLSCPAGQNAYISCAAVDALRPSPPQ